MKLITDYKFVFIFSHNSSCIALFYLPFYVSFCRSPTATSMIQSYCWPIPSTESWRTGNGTAWPVWAASGRTPNHGREARVCWILSKRYKMVKKFTLCFFLSRLTGRCFTKCASIMCTWLLWWVYLSIHRCRHRGKLVVVLQASILSSYSKNFSYAVKDLWTFFREPTCNLFCSLHFAMS